MKVFKKELIHYVIMFSIMFLVGSFNTIGNITPMGMNVLGVFLGAVYGWLTLDVTLVSLCGFVALMLCGYDSLLGLLSSGFSNSTIIMILVSTIFAGLVVQTDCLNLFIKKMFSLNFVNKTPWMIVVCIFALSIIGAFCGMGYAAIFLLWSLVLELTDACEIDRKSPFVTYMLSMISIIVLLTGICFPWRTQTLIYTSIYNPSLFNNISYFTHMIFVFCFILLFIAIMICFAKYILRLDLKKLELSEKIYTKYVNTQTTPLQKIGAVMVLLFSFVMLTASMLPTNLWITKLINDLGLVGVIFIILVVFGLLRDKNGERLISFEKCYQAIPWQIIWLLVFVLPLGNAMQSDECGIVATISTICIPIFNELSICWLMILAIVLVGLLTQVMNNMILAIIFMPIFHSICVALGGNTYLLFVMLLIVLHCDASTPAGSINGAIVHGHKNINKKYAYLFGIVEFLVVLIISIIFLLLFNF